MIKLAFVTRQRGRQREKSSSRLLNYLYPRSLRRRLLCTHTGTCWDLVVPRVPRQSSAMGLPCVHGSITAAPLQRASCSPCFGDGLCFPHNGVMDGREAPLYFKRPASTESFFNCVRVTVGFCKEGKAALVLLCSLGRRPNMGKTKLNSHQFDVRSFS